MRKLGLKLWSINTDYYYDEAIRLYRDNIFDYIELYVVPGSVSTLSKWKKLGIPFIIHAPHFVHGFNLANKNIVKNNYTMYLEVKEFADELLAEYIIFHGGIEGCASEAARQLKSFNERRALIENKPFRVMKNKFGVEFARGYNFDELSLIMDDASCGFCLDVCHAFCAAASQKINPYDYIEKLCRLIPKLYHLSDVGDVLSEIDAHFHFGKGELDFIRLFGMIGFDCMITIETEKSSSYVLHDYLEDCLFLKKNLNEISQD